MYASNNGRSGTVRILLDKGASISKAVDDDFTALLLAAGHGYLAITKLRVQSGANLESRSLPDHFTPLHVAANRGHLEVMSVLFEAGADPNSLAKEGLTPLCLAVQEGNLGATKRCSSVRKQTNPLLTRILHNRVTEPRFL